MNRRRLFIALSAAALLPSTARAQPSKRRFVIGVIRINPRDTNETFIGPFRRDMASLGWKENDDVEFLFAWAGGRNAVLEQLAVDMVARKVDVIVTFGPLGARAAQRATSTIPIVSMADDLVGAGLVQSMARPGRNTTGVSILERQGAGREDSAIRPPARRPGNRVIARRRILIAFGASALSAPFMLFAQQKDKVYRSPLICLWSNRRHSR